MAILPLNIASYSIPFRVPGSQRDRQLLHYFCVQAGSEISGYLGAESNPFWSHTVLRSSHAEPAVRQALVALSSLHLGYGVGDTGDGTERHQYQQITGTASGPVPGNTRNEEAVSQYGKALRMLQKRLDDGGAPGKGKGKEEQEQTAMICCVLFYCFESALGDNDGAMRHLENGLRILASARDSRRRPCLAVDDVAELLGRLDIQATMFNDSRAPSLALVSTAERETGIAELGASSCDGGDGKEGAGGAFRSVEAAQRALSRLQNWLFRLIGQNVIYHELPLEEIPPRVLEEKARLARDYARWRIMFDGFVEQQKKKGLSSGGEGWNNSVKILGVHHRLTQLLLESNLPENTAIFGSESNLEAGTLLDAIEDVVRSGSSGGNGDNENTAAASTRLRRSFSSETGVIAPLFLLAVKCADETVTARAARLLASCRRREGLYDAQVMAGVLKKLHAMREQKVRVLEEVPVDESLRGEGRGGLSEKMKGQMQIPLEFWAEDMVNSRITGFDAIGDGPGLITVMDLCQAYLGA